MASDGRLRKATIPWTTAKGVPAVACLTCNDETVTVPVFDARPSDDRETSVPYEVDEETVQATRTSCCSSSTGAASRRTTTTATPRTTPTTKLLDGGAAHQTAPMRGREAMTTTIRSKPGRADSYGVPAFVQARRHLGVVDNWAARGQAARQARDR